MITVNNVYKRYQSEQANPNRDWVLEGVSFNIPAHTNVGLIGRNGAGKSTLLRLIGGVDTPNKGKINRQCRVSWPMGLAGGLQGSLTGRQNSKFICRVQGQGDNISERIAFIEEFAEIGKAFDEPVKTYSTGMRSRLQFGLSLAFDFDVYISDEVTSAGDAAFRQKAMKAFRDKVGQAGLIMVSHSEQTLRDFCQAGILLDKGKAYWFDDISEALKVYSSEITH